MALVWFLSYGSDVRTLYVLGGRMWWCSADKLAVEKVDEAKQGGKMKVERTAAWLPPPAPLSPAIKQTKKKNQRANMGKKGCKKGDHRLAQFLAAIDDMKSSKSER